MAKNTLKEEVNARIDYKAYYEDALGGPLKKGPKGWAKVLCLFHKDTAPSLNVNLDDGSFNCFGCKEKGSIFDFHMRRHGLDFKSALKDLAQRLGIEIKSNGGGKGKGKADTKGKAMKGDRKRHPTLLDEVDIVQELKTQIGLRPLADQPNEQGLLLVEPISGEPGTTAAIVVQIKGGTPKDRLGYYLEFVNGKVTKAKSFFQIIAENKDTLFMTGSDVYYYYAKMHGKQPTATYNYVDATGKLLYQVLRYKNDLTGSKTFKQRRPDGQGGWIWNIDNIERVPYNLPDITKADVVIIVEGEKDCNNAKKIGLVSSCNSGGAGSWPPETNKYFNQKHVVIIPDNDAAGLNHAQGVALNLHGIATSIKFVELPGLPEKGDVSDWLDAGGTLEQLRTLIEAAPEWDPATAPPEESKKTTGESLKSPLLPQIVITKRPLSDLTDDSLAALVIANSPPSIFVRGGCLVRVLIDEKETPKITIHTETSLRGKVARIAAYERETDEGRVPTFPPSAVVKDLLALGEWPLPALAGIIESPVIRKDGTILETPGYDPATGLFYTKPKDLLLPAISPEPTREEVELAKYYLEEILCDFPFKASTDKANAMGLQITPIIRPAIRGAVPMALVDAPTPGTGKTLYTDIISIIATGKNAPVAGIPRDDDEMRKFLTSTLLAGNLLGCFDNIDHPIWSPSLCRLLTCTEWRDRILGKSEEVRLPHLTTWICNGNNLKLRGDLARRCFPIHFDSGMSKPWERTKFKHPRLREWVSSYRGDFIAAILTIARAWFVAGSPKPGTDLPVLGGFEAWTEMIGGILGFIGIEGFLGNLKDFHTQVDLGAVEWEAFLSAWLEYVGAEPQTCKAVAKVLRERGEFAATLPDNLGNILKDPEKSFEKSLGNALNRKENRPYGEKNLAFQRDSTAARAIKWKVVSR